MHCNNATYLLRGISRADFAINGIIKSDAFQFDKTDNPQIRELSINYSIVNDSYYIMLEQCKNRDEKWIPQFEGGIARLDRVMLDQLKKTDYKEKLDYQPGPVDIRVQNGRIKANPYHGNIVIFGLERKERITLMKELANKSVHISRVDVYNSNF